jgi:probable rRNA maturation factor
LVVGLDDQQTPPVDVTAWAALARSVLVAEGITHDAELNLTFVDRAEMTDLNRTHMGGDGPTDVLSFPLDDDPAAVPTGQPRLLGDIVICPEVVADQAPGAFDDEMALMVVHGVLHILGMDHADAADAAEMKAAEQRHLADWRSRS